MNPDDITSAWVDEVALRIAFLVAKRASVGSGSSVSSMTLPEFAGDEIGVMRFKSEVWDLRPKSFCVEASTMCVCVCVRERVHMLSMYLYTFTDANLHTRQV